MRISYLILIPVVWIMATEYTFNKEDLKRQEQVARIYEKMDSELTTAKAEYDYVMNNVFESLELFDPYIYVGGGVNVISSIASTISFTEQRASFYIGAPKYWPMKLSTYRRVTSMFGERINPFSKDRVTTHEGIDMTGRIDEPIYATAEGIVRDHWITHPVMGRHIIIEHENGYTTMYAHLSKSFVREGKHIKQGQLIGTMGSTGMTKGAHLHYEVRKDDVPIDPMYFLVKEF